LLIAHACTTWHLSVLWKRVNQLKLSGKIFPTDTE
jgi:hypothetical protein